MGVLLQMDKKPVGKIIHFFDKIGVAVVKAEGTMKVGDKVLVEGAGNSFEQKISSMQIDKEEIKEAKKGTEFGMKVDEAVKPGYLIYKA